ncbi:MAG: hypothetical protein RL482_406 [Actinomycetota bacterium]
MKLAKIAATFLIVVVAGCGAQSASQYATETSVSPEVSEPAVTETTADDDSITTTTETTIETTTTTTTTTTMPPTTTTVLDTLCVKLTQCQFANLVGVDFSRLQLDFQNFSVATLTGASFAGANLAKSLFIRADLSNVNFAGANLSGVDFTAANMTGANMEGANLTDAIFCDVDVKTLVGTTESQLGKVKKFKSKGKIYCP